MFFILVFFCSFNLIPMFSLNASSHGVSVYFIITLNEVIKFLIVLHCENQLEKIQLT